MLKRTSRHEGDTKAARKATNKWNREAIDIFVLVNVDQDKG
jgi:hypothetical protein